MKAYCYRSGKVEFGEIVPEGALFIAEGNTEVLRAEIEVSARHGYEEGVLLVPGVPEADSEEEAFQAFLKWRAWRAKGMLRKRLGLNEDSVEGEVA